MRFSVDEILKSHSFGTSSFGVRKISADLELGCQRDGVEVCKIMEA